MNFYQTLDRKIFGLGELPKSHKIAYSEVKAFYDKNPGWIEFSNFWMEKVKEVFTDKDPRSVVEEPLFEIFQDLESRIGIKQECVRDLDYRELLAEIIRTHFKSRYQFCKKMDVDEGFLSSVLARKKHFSIPRLQKILLKLGYRMTIEKI